jgi:hypothetical protein
VLKRRLKPDDTEGELGVHWVEQPYGTPPEQQRYEISWIDPNGAAAKSELKLGVVVTTVDGIDVQAANHRRGYTLMTAPPGTKLAPGLARGATHHTRNLRHLSTASHQVAVMRDAQDQFRRHCLRKAENAKPACSTRTSQDVERPLAGVESMAAVRQSPDRSVGRLPIFRRRCRACALRDSRRCRGPDIESIARV